MRSGWDGLHALCTADAAGSALFSEKPQKLLFIGVIATSNLFSVDTQEIRKFLRLALSLDPS
jgi:hypothetical protein